MIHEGRKVLELRPPVPIGKARAVRRLLEGVDVDIALYAGDDRTDVDAFEGLRELVDEGRLQQRAVRRRALAESPAEILKAADLLVPAGDGVRSLLRALTAGDATRMPRARLGGRALRRPAEVGGPAERRRGDDARGHHGACSPTTATTTCSRSPPAGWWLAALLIGARIGRRSVVSPAIERALREARPATSLPEMRAGADPRQPALAAAARDGRRRRGGARLARRSPAIAAGFGVMWALSWRRQDAAVDGDRGARRRDVLRRADLAAAADPARARAGLPARPAGADRRRRLSVATRRRARRGQLRTARRARPAPARSRAPAGSSRRARP